MIPQTVSLETAEINGVKVVKQMYADGSYGIHDDNTGCVKVYYPDGKKMWFVPIDGVYVLTAEEMPDGKMTFAQKDGIVKSESEKRDVTKYRRVEPLDWDDWPTTEEYTVSFKDYKFTFFDGSVYGVSVDDKHYFVDSDSQFIKTNQFSELNVKLGVREVRIVSENSFDGSEHKWGERDSSVFAKLSDGTERRWYKDGILESEKLPDGTNREYHINGHLWRETLSDGTLRLYNHDGTKIRENLSDGTRNLWYDNKQMKQKILPNGIQINWNKDGTKLPEGTYREWKYETLIKEYLPGGTEREWNYYSEKLTREKLPDGTEREWYENGNQKIEILPDSTVRWWYKNSQLELESLPDGTWRLWYENGNQKKEELPDGTERAWYENGNLASEKLPDGSVRTGKENGEGEAILADGTKQYFVDGKISSEKLIDGTRRTYDNGVLLAEYLLDNTTRRFYPNGQMSEQKLPNGSSAGWYIDGSKKFEEQPNGSRQEWHLNGNLSAEILCSKVDKHKISETRYDENGNRTHFVHYDKDGKDDTRMYLAKQKVAAKQVEKGAEKGKVQKKLNPIIKAWKMHKALKEVDAEK